MDRLSLIQAILFVVCGLTTIVIGAPTQPSPSDLYCHVCVDAASDSDCNKTKHCPTENGCLTSIWYDGAGHRAIQKRCTTKEICNSMETHNDEMCYKMAPGFDGLCSFCCLTPGCNKAIPGYATPKSNSPANPAPQSPPQGSLNPEMPKNDKQLCNHTKIDTGVVTVNDKGNVYIPGLKISINLEIPNVAPPCGCQNTIQPTQQVTTTTPVPTTMSSTPSSTTATTKEQTTPTTTITTTTTPTIGTKSRKTLPPPTTRKTTTTTTTPAPLTPTTTSTTTTTPTTTSTTTTTTTTTSTTTPKPTTTKEDSTVDPGGPKCFKCDDQTCNTQTLMTCSSSQPLCMSTLSQDIEGKRTFKKSCASETVCKKDWFTETSGLADCFLLDDTPTGSPGLKLDKCSFCCKGDGCNKSAVPFDTLWYPA